MKLITDLLEWMKQKWKELDGTPDWLIPREGWGAGQPIPDIAPLDCKVVNRPEVLPWPLPYVVIHSVQSFEDPGHDTEEIKKTMRELQEFDMEDKELDDIGYNFVIGGDGYVYEGRGWKREGEHTFQHNHHSIGIAFLGDYREKPPSEKMITVTRRLIEEGMRKRYLRGDVKVVTHRQLVEGAECPTKCLMEVVENDQVLKPDYQWSEWAWLFTIKRWINDAPQEICETVTKELKELKVRWRHSFVRNTIMYIWNN